MKGDGDIVFKHACKLGCEGIVFKAPGFALPLGTGGLLGEGQEPRRASGDARCRGRLGSLMVVERKKDRTGLDELAVEAPVLARWLGVSGKTVYELTRVGIAVRTGGGLYRLEESVRRYCEHIRQMAQQGGKVS